MVFAKLSYAKSEQSWPNLPCLKSGFNEVCPNDKLRAETELLHGLIGTIFKFREEPIAVTANIECFFCICKSLNQTRAA